MPKPDSHVYSAQLYSSDKKKYHTNKLRFFPYFSIITVSIRIMLSVTERIQESMCAICDIRSNSILCQGCKNESRGDFYLFLLTRIKDQCENYENLKTKCMDLQNVTSLHPISNEPTLIFNENLHTINEQAKKLIDEYTDTVSHDAVPVEVLGDGDCMLHTICAFYPTMSIDEIRCRCLIELCTHEQHYDSMRMTNGFDKIDDECVQDHVIRVLNNNQYTGVLTLAALANVLHRPVTSIYPKVNDIDECCDVLNTTFFPKQGNSGSQTPIRILWTGPDNDSDHDWRPNHFVPVMATNRTKLTSITISTGESLVDDSSTCENAYSTPMQVPAKSCSSKLTIEKEKIIMDEEQDENRPPHIVSGIRHTFLAAPMVIEQVLHAVTEKSVIAEPPKLVNRSSIFFVKFSEENRLSIGKDGNGV